MVNLAKAKAHIYDNWYLDSDSLKRKQLLKMSIQSCNQCKKILQKYVTVLQD